MDRKAQLRTLADDLTRLVEMLRLDADCQWREGFEQCMRTAQGYLQSGFTQNDLSSLSSSVTHVYGGMGSFNDYAPVRYEPQSGQWKPIPGMESFAEVAGQVYEAALSLRVIGQVA